MWLDRTIMLIGNDNVQKLKNSSIAVFGIGGVGSYCAEALVRAGIGNITLIDGDIISDTNINRQLIADTTTIGKFKVDIAKERYLKINPNLNINTYNIFFNTNTDYIIKNYDYVVDCIDSVSDKILLIQTCVNQNIPILSSMRTGNKLNPCLFEISDISKTSVCPLAKKIRKELRNIGISHLKVLYSKEEPVIHSSTPSSISFVPGCAGLILASEVIKDILL